jgi:hypothetical protein
MGPAVLRPADLGSLKNRGLNPQKGTHPREVSSPLPVSGISRPLFRSAKRW